MSLTDAVCMDGWYSYSTGSGTCSHHGGVDYWVTPGTQTDTSVAVASTPKTPEAQYDYTPYMLWAIVVGTILYMIHVNRNGSAKR